MWIKKAMLYHSTPTRMVIVKKTYNKNAGKDVEKQEPSYVACENCSHTGKPFGSFFKS